MMIRVPSVSYIEYAILGIIVSPQTRPTDTICIRWIAFVIDAVKPPPRLFYGSNDDAFLSCVLSHYRIGLIGKEKNTSSIEPLQRVQFSHICYDLHVGSVLLVKMVKPGQDLAKMKHNNDLPPTYHGHAGREDSITRDQSVHEGSKK